MTPVPAADDGELRFLRWQDPGCFTCGSDRCIQTGFVYDQRETFACAAASIADCSAATAPANADDDAFECAPVTTYGPLHASRNRSAMGDWMHH